LGFFSKKLTETESRYSTFDRELLAAYNTILHFRHYLEGRRFAVWTDHRPLVGTLARLSDPRSDRQRRQLSFISEFTADIQCIAGNNNTIADMLSRPADAQQPPPTPPLTYAQVVAGAAATASPSSAMVLSPLQQHAVEGLSCKGARRFSICGHPSTPDAGGGALHGPGAGGGGSGQL
jgi:hypothetical protein